jgi:disulfide bond formation protein DsbB
MALVFLGGMIGSVRPSSLIFKLPGLAVSLAGAAAGLRWSMVLESINLSAVMDPDYLPVCSAGRVRFPLGLPLDRWLPGHFAPGGVCGIESQYEFWGLTMPQWLIMICLVYLAGLFFMGVANFLPSGPKAARQD